MVRLSAYRMTEEEKMHLQSREVWRKNRSGRNSDLGRGVRLPQWLSGKESTCNAEATGDSGSIPGLGRSPGGGNGNPLQYSCLKNPMDRGAWWATIHGVTKSWTQVT